MACLCSLFSPSITTPYDKSNITLWRELRFGVVLLLCLTKLIFKNKRGATAAGLKTQVYKHVGFFCHFKDILAQKLRFTHYAEGDAATRKKTPQISLLPALPCSPIVALM